tara:strand:+ start:29082 stop:30026 length:945 start_codon:yes stop_codon:yes gene_type:complete
MSKVLVIAEHHRGKLTAEFLSTLGAAKQISESIEVALFAEDAGSLAESCALLEGVKKIWIVSHPCFSHVIAENIQPFILALAKDYTHILASNSTFGKNLMPRIAAGLDMGQISDVTEIISEDTFKHPIYAGNAFETVQSQDAHKVLTIRATAFDTVGSQKSAVPVETLDMSFEPNTKVQFVSEDTPELTRPELTSAKIVISGGRGLGSEQNFKLIEEIADKLNAAIGASRAAVDAGFVPNDYQVGQTGKVVAPDLYLAVGISGAIQHLAGMKDSKVIVAINKDPEAPIFQIADYGLVGDLFEILPEMSKALESL